MLKKALTYLTKAKVLHLLGLESRTEVIGYFVYAVTLLEIGAASNPAYEFTFYGLLCSFIVALLVRISFTAMVRFVVEFFD